MCSMLDVFSFNQQHVKHLLVKHSTLGCKSLYYLDALDGFGLDSFDNIASCLIAKAIIS